MKLTMLAGAAALALAAPATAAATFTLQNLGFNDGGTAAGSFTTDDAFTSVTSFAITSSAGQYYLFSSPAFGSPTATSGQAYASTAPLNTATVSTDQRSLSFFNGTAFLNLTLASPLALGTASLTGGESVFIIGRAISAGQLVGTPTAATVPEPASWAMMLVGFGLAGAVLRQRTAAVRFA